jgi:hypothetical protein
MVGCKLPVIRCMYRLCMHQAASDATGTTSWVGTPSR